MISYTEIKPGVILDLDGVAFAVVKTSGVVKKQRQKPHNTAKMRNIRTGGTVERTFTQSDKVHEADIEMKEVKYLYTNPKNHEVMFCDPKNPANRFTVENDILGNNMNYILENTLVNMRFFNDEIIGIKLADKVNLLVAEAPPNIRGNTTAGGNKVVVLETGLKVTTPLFINAGDTVRVNTETGNYSERV